MAVDENYNILKKMLQELHRKGFKVDFVHSWQVGYQEEEEYGMRFEFTLLKKKKAGEDKYYDG